MCPRVRSHADDRLGAPRPRVTTGSDQRKNSSASKHPTLNPSIRGPRQHRVEVPLTYAVTIVTCRTPGCTFVHSDARRKQRRRVRVWRSGLEFLVGPATSRAFTVPDRIERTRKCRSGASLLCICVVRSRVRSVRPARSADRRSWPVLDVPAVELRPSLSGTEYVENEARLRFRVAHAVVSPNRGRMTLHRCVGITRVRMGTQIVSKKQVVRSQALPTSQTWTCTSRAAPAGGLK